MASIKISNLFNNRFFEIPKYQRGYAWELQHIRDLFDDINEAIESGTNHYIGTIVLSKSAVPDKFYVVDGQQRIATITLMFNALINELPRKHRDYYKRYYLKEDGKYRIKLLNRDGAFFFDLIRSKAPKPVNKSQRYMVQAYEEIENKVRSIPDKMEFLKAIADLEIMEFIEESEGDAIRIFQTVNDRGKPLSNMDKAKSLLIYFSNRYLNKKLDDYINDSFSEIFEIYDDIKHIGDDLNIALINNVNFTEDSLMRYHFVTFSNENYDPTASFVLQSIKNKLSELRIKIKTSKTDILEKFISSYVTSLKEFFKGCKEIIEKAYTQPKYYKLFCISNLSARLYPIITKLQINKLLDRPLPSEQTFTFFDLIELIDIRVYKTRGTDPKKHIADFVYSINKRTENEIEGWLKWFNSFWMSNDLFLSNLNGNMFTNSALRGMLIEYSESLLPNNYTVMELRGLMKKNPTIEHIISQVPNFSPQAVGFADMEDFLTYEHKLGNLSILEKSLNSAGQNVPPISKVPFYDKSNFKLSKDLGSEIFNNKKFTKIELDPRTAKLATYCSNRWWC